MAYRMFQLSLTVAGKACSQTASLADLSETAPQKSLVPAVLAGECNLHGILRCWEQGRNSERRPLPINSYQLGLVEPALPTLIAVMLSK